jgi:hypothetical protein
MNHIKIITGTVPGIEARIYMEECPEPPENDIVKIAYIGSSRYTLGSQPCTRDELDQIGADIQSGKLVGVPVWAYAHSGSTLSTGTKLKGDTKARLRENPYHCPWDSGRSGWAYMTAKDALHEWGNKRLSAKQKQQAHHYIDGVVEEFAHYLQGDVYGIRVLDTRGAESEEMDECWGFYGYEHAVEEAESMLASASETVQRAEETPHVC